MFTELVKLANRLQDLGFESHADRVDNLIAQAARDPAFQEMLNQWNAEADPKYRPHEYSTQELNAITEQVKAENKRILEETPSKGPGVAEWTQHPKGHVNMFEIGRIRSEQGQGKVPKKPQEGFPVASPSTLPEQPDALQSLQDWIELGPHKGTAISLKDALEFANGYLSEFDISEADKEAQLYKVEQAYAA